MAEIELILATTTALGRICPKNAFTVRINDRGILKGMALHCGFPEDGLDQVFITLDKMDKIGLDGVKAELLELGYAAEQRRKVCRSCYPDLGEGRSSSPWSWRDA